MNIEKKTESEEDNSDPLKWVTWIDALIKGALAKKRTTYPMAYNDTGKLPTWKKISYGAPQLSMISLTMLISIHGTIFFTKIGAEVAFIAFFTALARSFDVITDPLMGYISDTTKSKHGRRRPFMMSGCWFYAILFLLLFTPPQSLGPDQVALWFGFFYILFYRKIIRF